MRTWEMGGRAGVGRLGGRPPPDPPPQHSPVLDLDVRPGGVHQLLPIPFSLEVHHLGLEAGAGWGEGGAGVQHWTLMLGRGLPPP